MISRRGGYAEIVSERSERQVPDGSLSPRPSPRARREGGGAMTHIGGAAKVIGRGLQPNDGEGRSRYVFSAARRRRPRPRGPAAQPTSAACNRSIV